MRGYVWCADHALTTSLEPIAVSFSMPRGFRTNARHDVAADGRCGAVSPGAARGVICARTTRHRIGDVFCCMWADSRATNACAVDRAALRALADASVHVVVVGDSQDVYAAEGGTLYQALAAARLTACWTGCISRANSTTPNCRALIAARTFS